ncbi:hypothetical protein BH24GEM2_BH24GEM2_09250 [soil metagenome]
MGAQPGRAAWHSTSASSGARPNPLRPGNADNSTAGSRSESAGWAVAAALFRIRPSASHSIRSSPAGQRGWRIPQSSDPPRADLGPRSPSHLRSDGGDAGLDQSWHGAHNPGPKHCPSCLPGRPARAPVERRSAPSAAGSIGRVITGRGGPDLMARGASRACASRRSLARGRGECNVTSKRCIRSS